MADRCREGSIPSPANNPIWVIKIIRRIQQCDINTRDKEKLYDINTRDKEK